MRLSGAPVARVTSCVFIVALSPYYSRSASHRLTHGSTMRHGGPTLRPQPSHSPHQLIKCDRQIADADACGVIDGVGDGGSSADDPDLANPLRTHWIDMQILLVDPGHLDRADISIGRDMVFREVR